RPAAGGPGSRSSTSTAPAGRTAPSAGRPPTCCPTRAAATPAPRSPRSPTTCGPPCEDDARVADPPLLRAERLRLVYPDGTVALDDLTLEVPRGAIGLVGANGAGKTTLLRLALGLLHPTAGSLEVVGR